MTQSDKNFIQVISLPFLLLGFKFSWIIGFILLIFYVVLWCV